MFSLCIYAGIDDFEIIFCWYLAVDAETSALLRYDEKPDPFGEVVGFFWLRSCARVALELLLLRKACGLFTSFCLSAAAEVKRFETLFLPLSERPELDLWFADLGFAALKPREWIPVLPEAEPGLAPTLL